MSEFSESYHLKSGNSDEAVQVLRRAGLKGFVFPSANDWVSFVAEEGQFAPDRRIVAQSVPLLLHYVYAEDHGWSFAFFADGRPLTSYGCQWDPEVEISDEELSLPALRAIAAQSGQGDIERVIASLHPVDFDEAIETELAKRFAEAIGLPHYDWLDFEHTARTFHESPDALPGVIRVTS